ncbi:MAG: NAD(P)-dependent oxidoreductase [Candidatus Korarchaeota archaeon]
MSAKGRILVTGAAGFTGLNAIPILIEKGYDVVATDVNVAEKDRIEKMGAKFVKCDLTDPESLKSVVRDVDFVLHIAALFRYSAPLDILRKINVEGTRNLLESLRQYGNPKFIVVWSSVAAYGIADEKHYRIPITEDQPLNPNCPGNYDLSKREQENVVREYVEKYGLPATMIRPAPIYGPGNRYGVYNIIKYVAKETLTIMPRNTQKVSVPLVHVRDTIESAIFLLGKKTAIGEAYNVVDDNVLNARDTLMFIASFFDAKPYITIPLPLSLVGKLLMFGGKVAEKKARKRNQPPKLEMDMLNYLFGNYYFSNEKIKKLGYHFLYPDRRIGLAETIVWYKQNGWL